VEQHSGYKIIVIFEWQDEVMRSQPEARSADNRRGKRERRTWWLLATTAPSKRSSAARTSLSNIGRATREISHPSHSL